ncbi:MAG: VOC family protein [Pseudomonadota bacterium]|nr:VOC family protein [Pseudomonadota bacterium]
MTVDGGIGLDAREGYARNVGATPAHAEGITATELYFRVPDLEASCAKLEHAGAQRLSAASLRPWGETAAYYADPDGNVVAVARR